MIEGITEEIERVCAAAMARPLYWFPVRHHSPACARFVRSAIEERRPRVVFIEAPAEAAALAEHILDRATKPPIAIYTAFRDDEGTRREAMWYPLLAYSPEYVAMLAARRVKAEVVFIDLPHFARTRAEGGAHAPKGGDRLMTESTFFHELARVARYRSFDEAWDSLFEVRHFEETEAFRRELSLFCAAARASVPASRIEADGTLERERFMRERIEQVLRARGLTEEDGLVVTGGFHMFLDETDRSPSPEWPSGARYSTLVPYSYPRVSSRSGYAAGCRAPRFYEHLWAGDHADLTTAYAIEVIREARKHGEPLSSADAVATAETASLLASLHRRATPILDDVDAALITCCIKGDPALTGGALLEAMARVAQGSRIGRVTKAVPRLPLLADFYAELERVELDAVIERDRPIDLDLDLRSQLGAARSVLLHRLLAIDVPIGKTTGGGARGEMFRETWTVRFAPAVEAALIEGSPYGDTIEAAVLARLDERIHAAGNRAGVVCGLLLAAARLELPGLRGALVASCRGALDEDGDFLSLCAALACLDELEQLLGFRGDARATIELSIRAFDRACLSMRDVIAAPLEVHEALVDGLRVLAAGAERPRMDRALFVAQLSEAAAVTTVPFLRGVFRGFLLELGEASVAELTAELRAMADAPEPVLVTAGEVLDGLMVAGRASLLLGADALVDAVDVLLAAASWESFMVMLPRLRGAMDRAGERSTRAIARHVASRYGLGPAVDLTEMPRALNLLGVRLDEEASRIIAEWLS